MSLTIAIITVVGLDLAVLAALAYVMRAPLGLTAHVAAPVAVAEQPQALRRPRRSVPKHVPAQHAAGGVR